jgi:hypothetical protein
MVVGTDQAINLRKDQFEGGRGEKKSPPNREESNRLTGSKCWQLGNECPLIIPIEKTQ